ncbi:MAG: LysR family transcriptional regulator [Lachnospiraceae bacterium]|nr:LysR family transcriptional regulator [Lachnospiraceae bacterium]
MFYYKGSVMNLNHIKSFLEVVEEGSFTRAAASLHQTQPGTSRHISALEQELGTQLFIRAPHKSPELTETGQIYYKAFLQCSDILQGARDQCDRISRSKELNLRFGYVNYWSTSWFLPSILETLKTLHPYLNISLECYGPSRLYSLVDNGDLDLAMTIDTPSYNSKKLAAKYICNLPRIMLYSDKLIEKHGEIKSIADLKDVPVLLPEDEIYGNISEMVKSSLEENGFIPEYTIVPNQSTTYSLVENGDGVMPNDIWCQYLFMPSYHQLPLGLNHDIVLINRKDCADNPVINTVYNALKKVL